MSLGMHIRTSETSLNNQKMIYQRKPNLSQYKHNKKSNYPPNRDTVTFELKGFDQNNLAGVLLHQIATFCVKMRMICAVMHE